jgi:hypothetical protein
MHSLISSWIRSVIFEPCAVGESTISSTPRTRRRRF